MLESLEVLLGSRLNVTVLRWLSQVNTPLSGNAIAKQLGLQQSSVRQALERLVETGVVRRQDMGSAATYTLEHRRAVVTDLLLPLISTEIQIRTQLAKDIATNLLSLPAPPIAGILYGSAIHQASAIHDVDVMLLVRKSAEKEPLREALLTLATHLEERYGVPLQPLVVTVRELQDASLKPLLKLLAREGVLLMGTPPAPLDEIRYRSDPVNA
jgi:DNA-binding transcriptional ArsR family regulator